MLAFAEAYPDKQFVQQLAAQILWFYNCVIMDKVRVPDQKQSDVQLTGSGTKIDISRPACGRQG